MSKYTPEPWEAKASDGTYFLSVFIGPELPYRDGSGSSRASVTINTGPSPEAVAKGFGMGTTMETANANTRLIARSPSMLALLEKALPIIEEEAERRTFSYSPKQNTDSYWSEMRDLANEISAEIDKARGKGVSDG